MYLALREVTKDPRYDYQPHVYIVNKTKDKLYGFCPVDGESTLYPRALRFSTRYRKFEKVAEYQTKAEFQSLLSG